MNKKRLLIVLIVTVIPHLLLGKAAEENPCRLPGINPLIFFPFGQKSDALKIECIQKGYSTLELISLRLPIDREDIGRLELPEISLATFSSDSIKMLTDFINLHAKDSSIDDITVIPTVLFFKKNMHSILGIELTFPQREQRILNLERIAFFFVQNITKEDADDISGVLGFNRLALYNADDLYNKIIIIGETHEQRKEIHALLESIFNKITTAHANPIAHMLVAFIKPTLEALAESSVGLVIEERDKVHTTLTEYHALENIASSLLSDNDYLFYNPTNKTALALVEAVQKYAMPLATNYYLYGKIMGYDEKQIRFKYQLEAYLRSINRINTDGTVRWPYNIPKWLRKHKAAVDEWVDTKWNAPFHFFYPKERRRYERDKKKARKYLKHIPLKEIV